MTDDARTELALINTFDYASPQSKEQLLLQFVRRRKRAYIRQPDGNSAEKGSRNGFSGDFQRISRFRPCRCFPFDLLPGLFFFSITHLNLLKTFYVYLLFI
jgi:hypothetical protein